MYILNSRLGIQPSGVHFPKITLSVLGIVFIIEFSIRIFPGRFAIYRPKMITASLRQLSSVFLWLKGMNE